MRWRKVTLLGVGLLGGSLGLALKRRRLAAKVCGFVRRPVSIQECLQARAVDEATVDLGEAVTGADLLVLCTPLAQMEALLKSALPFISQGTVITDVGSVKGGLVKSLDRLARKGKAHFVGSHPMAGGEKTGVKAALPGLFERAVCVVTPLERTDQKALARVENLWQEIGCKTLRLSPQQHDVLVSRSSHLPHVLAAALAHHVLQRGRPSAQPLLCANGFRDSTRIASSSPEMWRDIALMNRSCLLKALKEYRLNLQNFEDFLRQGNKAKVMGFFETAHQLREEWIRKFRTNS